MKMVVSGKNARLLLGVDGGGSKTAARIAELDSSGKINILGCGCSGSSNMRSAGRERALFSLDQAIDEAFADAGKEVQKLDSVILALAGSTQPDVRHEISTWAASRELASHIEIIHDTDPVLVAGTDNGWGIALIVGTGSVAIGVDPEGNSTMVGGWGHWYGDKGSGFYIACKALDAIAEANDATGEATLLTELILETLGLTNPRSIFQKMASTGDMRRDIASLAPLVLKAAAARDKMAVSIVDNAVEEVVKLVDAAERKLALAKAYPLALAGGIACSDTLFRDQLVNSLAELQSPPGLITFVEEPVLGCLEIAKSALEFNNTNLV